MAGSCPMAVSCVFKPVTMTGSFVEVDPLGSLLTGSGDLSAVVFRNLRFKINITYQIFVDSVEQGITNCVASLTEQTVSW